MRPASTFSIIQLSNSRAAGIRTTLDDFGAGYSILNTVMDIPADTLKLDREFVRVCRKSQRGLHFLERLIGLMSDLDYRIVCEGVETEAQAVFLREMGCSQAQGYWFAKPMPIEEFERLLYGPQ